MLPFKLRKEIRMNTPINGNLTIYQLRSGEANRHRLFESFESLHRQGEKPEFKNYSKVYSMEIDSPLTLDAIYTKFNIDKPSDFTGRSLAVSDIIVLNFKERETEAYYVNDFGFVRCPEFARQHYLETYRSANYYGHNEYLAKLDKTMNVGRPMQKHSHKQER